MTKTDLATRAIHRPEPAAQMVYRAAAIQFDPAFGEKQANLDRMLQLLEKALATGIQLAVLPEMATTGYCWHSREEIEPQVEVVPGPSTDAVTRLAAKYNAYVVFGLPEVEPTSGAFFNTAVLIGPDGIETKYRKTHSYMTEVRWAADGDIPMHVVETPIGRLGILICMDAEYPEPARVLALNGCDVVCFPANWGGEKAPSPYWMTRAWENGAYWVASNRSGTDRGMQFDGGSSIIGPDGRICDRIDSGEGWATAEISLEEARESRAERLRIRRPEAYASILQNTYLWPNTFRTLSSDLESVDGLLSGSSHLKVSIRLLLHEARDSTEFSDLVMAAAPAYDLIVARPVSLNRGLDSIGALDTEFARLGKVCVDTGTTLVTGVVNGSGEAARLERLVFISPDGAVHTRSGGDEQDLGSLSDRIIRAPWGTVGVMSGAELVTPEVARCVAGNGADVLAVVSSSPSLPPPYPLGPTAVPLAPPTPTGHDAMHWYVPRVRAAENNVWLAFAGPPGVTSGVFGPLHYAYPRRELVSDGRQVDELSVGGDSDERRVLACVTKPYLRMRRPHLYESLVHAVDGSAPRQEHSVLEPSLPNKVEEWHG
jgi:predicted amidohydrolase